MDDEPARAGERESYVKTAEAGWLRSFRAEMIEVEAKAVTIEVFT